MFSCSDSSSKGSKWSCSLSSDSRGPLLLLRPLSVRLGALALNFPLADRLLDDDLVLRFEVDVDFFIVRNPANDNADADPDRTKPGNDMRLPGPAELERVCLPDTSATRLEDRLESFGSSWPFLTTVTAVSLMEVAAPLATPPTVLSVFIISPGRSSSTSLGAF